MAIVAHFFTGIVPPERIFAGRISGLVKGFEGAMLK